MIAVFIGISSALLIILMIAFFSRRDKQIIYGLILSGIGFLYIGFTWSDAGVVLINGAQAVLFMFISWWGIRKGPYILAAGYFLHGSWDLVYDLFPDSS